MLLFPGVTGSSSEEYVKEMCGAASKEGYVVAVLNCLYTKDHEVNQRLVDPNETEYIKESIDLILKKIGEDSEIYGVGFSLGANHLLRYLGAHNEDCRLKAAVSISNPFDVMATCVTIKYAFFGIYDKFLKKML